MRQVAGIPSVTKRGVEDAAPYGYITWGAAKRDDVGIVPYGALQEMPRITAAGWGQSALRNKSTPPA